MTPHYRRKHLIDLSYDVSSWVFKNFAWLQKLKEVTSSSSINILGLSILEVLPCMMLTILFLIFNTITLTLVLDHNCEFINGMKFLYLTYWTYSQMDISVANPTLWLKIVTKLSVDRNILHLYRSNYFIFQFFTV